MPLTPEQQSVLKVLTTEWQTPAQLAGRLGDASENVSGVNRSLRDLLRDGLAQANPAVLGLYRLTAQGIAARKVQSEENPREGS